MLPVPYHASGRIPTGGTHRCSTFQQSRFLPWTKRRRWWCSTAKTTITNWRRRSRSRRCRRWWSTGRWFWPAQTGFDDFDLLKPVKPAKRVNPYIFIINGVILIKKLNLGFLPTSILNVVVFMTFSQKITLITKHVQNKNFINIICHFPFL